MDGLGHKLQTRLNNEPSQVPVVDSIASVMLVGKFELCRHDTINQYIRQSIIDIEKRQQQFTLRSVYQNTIKLMEQVEQSDNHERQALQTFITFLSCMLGSLFASFSLAHNRRVPRQVIQLMSTTVKYDIASMLKLASVFFCSGKLGKVEAILQTVEDRLCSHFMLTICRCYEKPTVMPEVLCHMMYALKGKRIRTNLFAHCVRFSRHEIHCAPPALRHEMYKEIGNDIQHRDPVEDGWMVLAAVDCLPFLYFLQYLTYKQLRKHDLQVRSLHNLDRCVREDKYFRHLETAWNLLGQCREDEQDPDAAMACYWASLEIRRRNNAANWHVAILWYKLIKNRCLLPEVTRGQAEK